MENNNLDFSDFDEQYHQELQGMKVLNLDSLRQEAFERDDPFAGIRTNKILLGETIRGMSNMHPLALQKVYKRSSKEIAKYYFPDATNKDLKKQSISVNIDIDCEEAQKLLVNTAEFFYDYNKNHIMEANEFAFKMHLFASKDGLKLKEAFECVEAKKGEILLFIEDNTDDWSEQIVRIKIADDVRTSIKQKDIYGQCVLDHINISSTGLSEASLKQLVETGELVDKVTFGSFFLSGLYYLFMAISFPAKAIGWIVEKIGDGIEYLKLPDSAWDAQNENYWFSKENTSKLLSIDPTFLDILEKSLESDSSKLEWIDFIPDFVSQRIKQVLNALRKLIEKYNLSVENFVEESSNNSELPEWIALFAGIYNGIIDFVASLFKFIGVLMEAPYDIADNWQDVLEILDNILESIKNISWSTILKGVGKLFNTLKAKLLDEDGNLDFVRIAYMEGYIISFIGTLFIPLAGEAGLLAKVAKIDKLIPKEVLTMLEKPLQALKAQAKNAKLTVLLSFERILSIFAKGEEAIINFFKKLGDDIAEWFLNNKKLVSLVEDVDSFLLALIKTLKKNAKYLDSLEYIKLIGRPLGRWIALEQEAAINLYTKSYYILFNKALRKLDKINMTPEYKAMQKVLDDALEKLPAFDQKGNYLWRSTYFTEEQIKKLFKAGKDFIDKGFFSTTHSEQALLDWMVSNPTDNVLFKVFGKNGKLIEMSSSLPLEAEVLFKSGTTFVVESVEKYFDKKLMREITEIILKEK